MNPLYSRGFKRVGCFPCIMGGKGSFKLTARDEQGREHLKQLDLAIDAIKVKRPTIRIHEFFEHDIKSLLKDQFDPFGLSAQEDEASAGGCSWCSL